jgi:hypothetical protein
MTQSAISGQYTAAKYYSISSDSTHIHGTHVPVEEPSTASQADMCKTDQAKKKDRLAAVSPNSDQVY